MEGPSVHRIADRLQRLVGQRVRAVAGNARQPIDALEGATLDRLVPVKKRLVLATRRDGAPGPAAVIHFLMYGTWRLNEHREPPARLSVDLAEDTFNVYNGSVKVVEPGELDALDPAGDVLYARFDASRPPVGCRRRPRGRSSPVPVP